MKTYAIFIFIPLLLLYEKNIKKIFMNILLFSSLLVILKLYLKGEKDNSKVIVNCKSLRIERDIKTKTGKTI